MHFAQKAVAMVAIIAAAILFIAFCVAPRAEGNSEWYRSLMIPGTQSSCCSEADCGPVKHRETADGYDVLIDGRWLPVPPAAILNNTSNPTGSAVACYLPSRGIMCFVRPAEA